MDILLVPMLLLFKAITSMAIIIVVSDVIIGWLTAANILNVRNQFVYALVSSLAKIAECMLRPIREKIPVNIGMIDFSPVVLILLLTFLENIINRILIRII
jgi:YggT family protein